MWWLLLQDDGQEAWRDDTAMAACFSPQWVFQDGWTKACYKENATFQEFLVLENVKIKLNLRLKKNSNSLLSGAAAN